jgi:translocation and assembly module TamA
LPRDRLFFAGGMNSVRGYGYQLIGDVNDDKKPLGGWSTFEVGIEPRFKISDNFGAVVFVEGGGVYQTKAPKIGRKMLWGGGVGVRYYTPLGPIRLDIAFPFKRRKTTTNKKIDSLFNIYISIGQAF